MRGSVEFTGPSRIRAGNRTVLNCLLNPPMTAPATKAATLPQGSARQRPAGVKRTASVIDGSTLVRGNAERFEAPPLHYVASWRHAQTRIRAKDKYEDAVLAYQFSDPRSTCALANPALSTG